MQRTYEIMFIVRPDIAEEDVDKLISGFENSLSTAGGTLKSVDKMGKRRLAYLVRKFSEGQYVLLTVQATGKAIHELERRMRVSEPVIKFITVRTDQEQKRIAKVKALRATKVRRVPEQPAAVTEGAVQAENPATA